MVHHESTQCVQGGGSASEQIKTPLTTVSQDGPAESGFGWYPAARMRRTTSLSIGMATEAHRIQRGLAGTPWGSANVSRASGRKNVVENPMSAMADRLAVDDLRQPLRHEMRRIPWRRSGETSSVRRL